MANRKVLDEEPFDIDTDGADELVSFDDEGEDLDVRGRASEDGGRRHMSDDDDDDDIEDGGGEENEEEEEDEEEEEHLSDADLDRYEDVRRVAAAAEAKAEEAAAAARASAEKGAREERIARIEGQRTELTHRIDGIRAKLRTAFEEADSEAHVALTEELADLKGQQKILDVYLEQEKNVKPPVQPPRSHPKAVSWLQRNSWFQSNEEARIAAIGYANTLEAQGLTPDNDEYYTKVDKHMRRRYPELFPAGKKGAGKKKVKRTTSEREQDDAPPARPADRGGKTEGNRSPRNARQVKLTALQVRLAKQWNVPKEEVAKEILRQQKREAEGGR